MGRVNFHSHNNDMHESSNQIGFVHSSDDAIVFASDSGINNVHATVNMELVGVDNWLKPNSLSLNVSKTSYMKISNQKSALDINIRESIITKFQQSNSLVLHSMKILHLRTK